MTALEKHNMHTLTPTEKRIQEDNINLYSSLNEQKYGREAVQFVFKKYDATGFYDLSPSYYQDIFYELYGMYYND